MIRRIQRLLELLRLDEPGPPALLQQDMLDALADHQPMRMEPNGSAFAAGTSSIGPVLGRPHHHMAGHLLCSKGDRNCPCTPPQKDALSLLDEEVVAFGQMPPQLENERLREKINPAHARRTPRLPKSLAGSPRACSAPPFRQTFITHAQGYVEQLLSDVPGPKTGYFDPTGVSNWIENFRISERRVPSHRISIRTWHRRRRRHAVMDTHLHWNRPLADLPDWKRSRPASKNRPAARQRMNTFRIKVLTRFCILDGTYTSQMSCPRG